MYLEYLFSLKFSSTLLLQTSVVTIKSPQEIARINNLNYVQLVIVIFLTV